LTWFLPGFLQHGFQWFFMQLELRRHHILRGASRSSHD
jgi:hypothetical protein